MVWTTDTHTIKETFPWTEKTMHSRKITAVYRSKVSTFPSVHIDQDGQATLSATPAWEQLKVKIPAELSESSKTDDRSRQWTAKLEMTVCQRHYDTATRYAYLLQQADGTQLLMGGDSRPYPLAETSVELSDSTSKSQMHTVTVTLTDTHPLPMVSG